MPGVRCRTPEVWASAFSTAQNPHVPVGRGLAPAAKRSRGGTASGGAQTAKSMQACVGAGLKCPPEQRRERKELLSVMKSKFYFRRNKLQYFTFCGRAQRPAPTTTGFIF